MTATPVREKWQISTWGLVSGIFIGLIYFGLVYGTRILLGMANSFVESSSSGMTYSSDVLSFVEGNAFLALVIVFIIVSIAHRTIKRPFTVRGPIKMALGALTGLLYYFLLAGGIITFAVGLESPASGTFDLTITLLVTLALLEVSAGLRVVQGGLEFREGRMEERAAAAPASPTPLPARPAVPMEEGAVFCRNCGTKLVPGAAFCGKCGAPRPHGL
jgi:zinc-ribbon domain